MKKLTILFGLTLMTTLSFSQEFLGVKPNGNKQDVINKFIQKGFKQTSKTANVVMMDGVVNNVKYEVHIVSTPISKKVWKLSIYLPRETNWYSIKTQYYKFADKLKEKYGEPNNTYETFLSPYYEGDGYEMSALRNNKVYYYTTWDNMSIGITEFEQINICYEDKVNSELYDEEKNRLDKNTF